MEYQKNKKGKKLKIKFKKYWIRISEDFRNFRKYQSGKIKISTPRHIIFKMQK